mmetsp:Transcript_18429/g.32649  ORF Transcript_18429/g.32649 Transcript_18429/m.32649 type:complete len:586 (+) Transcript_18429:232-1989(+)|eukprot:CAMPEP_0184560164 /NCGR_PEP_ID=MMETSP0199_2-20130426/46796_1 /TAXON_ID=1112570 /ORGANISM="Thraustochytrium sp., Strain LLF1b" /LENGTH=585 /DNA_ID=CAMNT_0026957465 /DNA_START=353 /DNA_END=2110 /DNA_ORIENTATION=-
MTANDADPKSLYSIAVLIDELKHEDMRLRLNSMSKLPLIADALGPERTRKELVPFLTDSIDDEDEVLLVVAEMLGKFEGYIGGSQHISCLLPPLESLATVEEATVRDEAIASMKGLAEKMSVSSLEDSYVAMLRRLSTKDWFTSRISACSLFTVAYPRVSTANKAEFRGMFGQLCRDDTPMVRRAAAANLGEFASVVEPEHVLAELLPLFSLLEREEQDSVRLLAIKNAVTFANLVDKKVQSDKILPMVLSLTTDKSWRVRWSVADKFYEVCDALGEDLTRQELTPAFVKLLADNEAEVRTAAAGRVTEVAKCMQDKLILDRLLPSLEKLVKDPSDHVRASLALVVMGLAPLVGRAATIESFLPLFLLLLNDNNPEVRLNIISNLGALNKVIGVDLLSQSLLPAIVKLAEDSTWRIRLAIIEHVPLLAEQLGVKFFEDSLSDLCMSWLADTVFSIREAAASNLKNLTETFGEPWAKKNIVPRIVALDKHTNYLCRMTALRAVEVLATLDSTDLLNDKLVDLVFQMTEDKVPNVRFRAAKCLEEIGKYLRKDNLKSARKALDPLTEEEDEDVKYFAQRAVTALETL